MKLLNFYFKKIGFKTKASKKYLNYTRKEYEIKLFHLDRKAVILFDNQVIYETGLPTNELSIIKWCNILINKHEQENNQIDSED